jgi:hypothetical protein
MGEGWHGNNRELYVLYGEWNEDHQLGTGFFVHKRIVPAVRRVRVWGQMVLSRQKYRPVRFVPELSISEFEIAIGKLKRCKSPGADQIPAERI